METRGVPRPAGVAVLKSTTLWALLKSQPAPQRVADNKSPPGDQPNGHFKW